MTQQSLYHKSNKLDCQECGTAQFPHSYISFLVVGEGGYVLDQAENFGNLHG